MKFKEKFNHNMLKINANETIFVNYIKINVVMNIINNKQKNFQLKKTNYKY